MAAQPPVVASLLFFLLTVLLNGIATPLIRPSEFQAASGGSVPHLMMNGSPGVIDLLIITICTAFAHIAVMFLGGRTAFQAFWSAMVLLSAVGGVVQILMPPLPIISKLVFVWDLVLTFIAFMVIHELSLGRAFGAVAFVTVGLFAMIFSGFIGLLTTQPHISPPSIEVMAPASQPRSAAPSTPVPKSDDRIAPSAAPVAVKTREKPQSDEVTVNVDYYDIHGRTANELRADLDRLGPKENGESGDARTTWHISWRFNDARAANGCAIEWVRTKVEVTTIMPRWTDSSSAPEELRDRWDRYLAALKTHEDGHKDMGIRAASEIKSSIARMNPHPTCDSLDEAANAVGYGILNKYRRIEEDYEATTDHGRTQGARFP